MVASSPGGRGLMLTRRAWRSFSAGVLVGLFLMPGSVGLRADMSTRQSSQEAPATPADADFRARCGRPDVIRCFGFDSSADLPSYYLNESSDHNGKAPVLDTTTYASGGGSVKCNVDPNTAGPDACGSWHAPFRDDNTLQIGQGQEFYVQWRQKFQDDYYLYHDFGISNGVSWKQIFINLGNAPGCDVTRPIYHGVTWGVDNGGDAYPCAASCTNLELVQVNKYNLGYPTAYHSCGHFESFNTAWFSGDGYGANDYMLQGTQRCLYRLENRPKEQDCVGYVAGQWMTFQYHIKVNQWNAPKNIIEVWIAQDGQPSKLVWSMQDYYLFNDCPTGRETNCKGVPKKFGNIWLSSYMTGHRPEIGQPLTATWWDELIIARSRIPDPLTNTPQPPSLLRTIRTGPGSITIAWQSNSGGTESGFKIERCKADSYYCHSQTGGAPAWHEIATAGAGVTSYTDSTLASGQVASYRVRAYNASGNSAYAGAACHDPANYPDRHCPGTGLARPRTRPKK